MFRPMVDVCIQYEIIFQCTCHILRLGVSTSIFAVRSTNINSDQLLNMESNHACFMAQSERDVEGG